NWEDYIVYLGKCKDVCAACEEEILDQICGIDNLTYNNKCSLYQCPKSDTAEQCVNELGSCVKCGGKCVDAAKCSQCLSSPCDMVCGLDGNTYPNVCTASCEGINVDYPYPCCKECPETGTPVCGEDFHTYKNQCFLDCIGIGKLYDGACSCNCDMTGPEVCGKNDGKTYPNECWANCLAGGVLYEGPCKTLCPQCGKDFTPVCGKIGNSDPKTFQNQCFLECQSGTKTGDGACQACIDLCGTPQNPKEPLDGPVCGEEEVTYPTSCFPKKCTVVNFETGACS
ncbi:MAG: hypothetical protein FJ088_07820, partial [Deltaproteobacteria bacterium]|nr:hypothetical protein [Deltaproteobacteria bacterium]